MAVTALLKTDLHSLSKSWVVRIWVFLVAAADFVMLAGPLSGKQGLVPASAVLTPVLMFFLYAWSTVVIVLSAGSVSQETEMIADGILSRACTRTQYILAKLAARALLILGVYAAGAGIAGYCAWRYGANDTSPVAILTGIGLVGMALLLLVSLGVAASVVANNTLYAVIGVLLLWYVASPIFSFAGAEYLSPDSLKRNLPLILRDAEGPQVVSLAATPSNLTLTFSKRLESTRAQQLGNYAIECPPGTGRTPTTATYDETDTRVVLAGLKLPAGKKVKVKVSGVTDAAGNDVSPAADVGRATVSSASPDKKDPGSRKSESAGERGAGESKEAKTGNEASTDGATDRKKETDSEPAPGEQDGASGSSASKNTAGSGRSDTSDRSDRSEPEPTAEAPTKPAKRAGKPVPFRVVQCVATESSLKVLFSRPLKPKEAERTANYVIESPLGRKHTAKTASYLTESDTVLLSGVTFVRSDPVKVTVKGVHDTKGNLIPGRGNSALYSEVTTWKYLLGFGAPALLFGLLAVVAFSRRDL